MVADAEQHVAEDADRERIEARNWPTDWSTRPSASWCRPATAARGAARGAGGKIAAVRQVMDGVDVSQVRQAAMDLRTTLLELNPAALPQSLQHGGRRRQCRRSAEESGP